MSERNRPLLLSKLSMDQRAAYSYHLRPVIQTKQLS